MGNEKNETYVLVATDLMEDLLKSHFMSSQSVLLFEYLCSQSNYPMFLSAESACEVLGLSPETLEQCRRKRTIRARVFGRQFLYDGYDLVALSCKLNQRKIQRIMRSIPKVVIG